MPSAKEVHPRKWSDYEIHVLYDDKKYSVISGWYRGKEHLGERWNGGTKELGFPNVAGYPIWHVVPRFLEIPILKGILNELARRPKSGYADAVRQELQKRQAL